MPQSAAGTRVDPPVSDPRPQVTMPAAMAAAVPPEEPPGIRVLSYGFFTGPANDDRLVLVMPNASSCMLVLPIMMTPAFKSFCNVGGRYLLVPYGSDDFGGRHETGIGHCGTHMSEGREGRAGGNGYR